ncbi:glutamine synthetase family protein [Poseidonocella sp. HB161398]|uniref:glutamine synthetase family protein n=1 Tax=Poseidonocella sp. HB161398 TaxID=2320855 RepID=UPI001F0FF4A9|nr:glutamine synthetase family protein [Poseidonocella sp. HB161398]
MTFEEEYKAYCAEYGEPERIELLLCDLNGIFRGKWMPGDQWKKIAKGKVRIPYSTCAVSIRGHEVTETGLGIVVGDPDGVLVPVPGTLVPVPWADRPTAQVLVDLEEELGVPSDLSPRTLLKRVLARYAEKGWTPVVAPELEFYALEHRESVDHPPQPPERTPPAQNYDMEVMHRASAWLDEIGDICAAQNIPTDTVTAEYGPGQFEVNFHHGPALDSGDRAVLFRRAVRGVLGRHGLEGTFMAKPYGDEPGSGMHVHVSVLDSEGRNIFDQPGEPGPLLSSAVAGTLATMRDLHAIFAPHMNSFRRFGAMSFAPNAPEWGLDHRGVAVRVAESSGVAARLEHRIAGADSNPYMVIAAILGGMLYGIERGLEPGPMIDEEHEPKEPLTAHWELAVDRFATSEIAAEIFGEAFRDVFVAVKRKEIEELTTIIPPLEYETYLTRF